MTGALEGDLGRFPAADVLQFLGFAGATGRLELERPGERAEIHLEGGRPVRTRTSRGSVRLGEVLVHRGTLSERSLAAALEAQRDRPGEPLGGLLVALGAARSEDVTRALDDVMRRILLGILLWPGGRFRFDPGTRLDAGGVPFAAALDPLLLEGLHQVDEIAADG